MNRGPKRHIITTSARKIDQLLSVGQPVRAKLDDKRRLWNGDLRWLSHVRLYQSLDVKLEDGMTRRKSYYIRVSNNELPILILFTRTIPSSTLPSIQPLTVVKTSYGNSNKQTVVTCSGRQVVNSTRYR
jgi:hypothetical protein